MTELTELHELQIALEKIFSLKHVEDRFSGQWSTILKPITSLLNPEDKETKKLIRTCIYILYLLSERQVISYHNLIEMTMSKADRNDSIVYISKILDLGVRFNLWRYDQLPYQVENGYALNVRANYTTTDECKAALANVMYALPMVVEPVKVRDHVNNRGSGYLLTPHDSLILNGKWYEGSICREYLDTVNSVKLSLNQDVISLFQHKLDKESIINNVILNNAVNGTNTNPDYAIKQAEDNWNLLLKQTEISTKLLEGKIFYLTHKYDTRGRCYAQGYHINTQGDSYCKAMIELANKEEISQSINFNLE